METSRSRSVGEARLAHRGIGICVLMLAAAWHPAFGQWGMTETPFHSACEDSIAASEMRRVVVYAGVDLPDSAEHAFRMSADNLLQDIIDHVPPLLGGRSGVLPHGDPRLRWPDIRTRLLITAHRDGHVTWRMPSAERASAGSALLGHALDATLADGSTFLWSADSLRDSVEMQITYYWPTVDRHGKVRPDSARHAEIPVFSLPYPWEEHTSAKPAQPAPRYPEGARDAGYQATILMQFIVDTSGRAVTSTIRDLWPKGKPPLSGEKRRYYLMFRDAASRDIPRIAFNPTLIGGCKVPQLVQMPFLFKLSR